MSTPFDSTVASIPVTIVTDPAALGIADSGAARIRLEPALHDHAPGSECVACAARSDIRALLFDLLQRSRTSGENPVLSVVVDATEIADPKPIIARLEKGTIPAFGLRDHTVAQSFHLARVI